MASHADMKEANHQVGPPDRKERQYLEGLRLIIVLGSLTLVSFLVLLDMSILGTVG